MTKTRTGAPACLTVLLLAGAGWAADEPVDYVRTIKPLLSRSCIGCHGPDKQRSGLRLDTAAAARAGGDSGPALIPGNAKGSRLVRAIRGEPGVEAMPPKPPRLTVAEIDLIERWIDQGAIAPAVESASLPAKALHWSFRPIEPTQLPKVRDPSWARNGIDRFILSRLEKEQIAPAPETDRVTLLRRLSMDLIGLPPSPEEVDSFLADGQPDAYERQVNRLLASPHYGERWGRHWLDLARYADSNGYSIDAPRTIWPYRDWVIKALNSDMPFDRFTVEQLAGDLQPKATMDDKIATGFHRNTQINEEGGIDKEQFRVEAVIDRVNTTGSVWLGLTVGCCQCHNHKFDPLSQREYYQFFAFFNNQDDQNLVVGKLEAAQPAEVKKPKKPGEVINPALMPASPTEDENKAALKARILTSMVMRERATQRETHILMGGDFTRPGASASPGTPAVLPPLPKPARSKTPTRLDLAKWLVSPENPLTARVLVNRIWGHYFGLGLVETDNDFGTQGTPPSHPELLDWLASTMIRDGWSLKQMHRLIVTSATYCQDSKTRPELASIDPRNRLLARQQRLRLEAEAVRDAALMASGLLDSHIGGPSVFPPQPAGVDQFTQVKRKWAPSAGPSRYRRGLYTYFWRASPHPALSAFDAPDAGTTCTRRNRSNTPLQALTLLNDAGFAEYAYGLAARLLYEYSADDRTLIHHAFRICLSREPTWPETERLMAFLSRERQRYVPDAANTEELLRGGGPAGEALAGIFAPANEKAALVLLARVLFNLDEFITRE
ncbi:MAG TPA: PSD1 and planctomycete cytochrome C domain-containing protein [Gemmataceae bacterium]|jgi:mono/diheme cytochrome c family protein|nr:PSD1 and planctomycete cytochrome C domain-containing protein [Gemmataceae bacterium]